MNEDTIQAARAAFKQDPETACKALLGCTPEEMFITALRGCNQHAHKPGCPEADNNANAKAEWTVDRARHAWLKRLNGKNATRTLKVKGIDVDIAVNSSFASATAHSALRNDFKSKVGTPYEEARKEWEVKVLPILRERLQGRKNVRYADVEAHIKSGKIICQRLNRP